MRKTLDTTHMAVDIQGKGCCVMSQVALDGLDIVPSLQESHCVAVAQVMKPCVRHTDIIGDALEVVVRGAGRQVSTHGVAKHIEMVCQRMRSVSDHRTYHTPPLITMETLCSKSSEKERIGYETLKSNHKKQRKFHRVLRIHRASATSSATQAKNQLFSYKNSEFFLLYVVRSKFYNFDFTGDCQILQTVFWLYHRKGAPFHKEHLSCWFSMPWVLISR